jgi:hypothetical protein
MSARRQPYLFEQPKVSKRELRAIKRKWLADVEGWARGVLQWDVWLQHYTEPRNELSMIKIDGSGPPDNWHDVMVRGLTADIADAGVPVPDVRPECDRYTNRGLLKLAIRLGRCPRSVTRTMPPKPAELLERRP